MSQHGFGAPNLVPFIVPPVPNLKKTGFSGRISPKLAGIGVAHRTRTPFDIGTSKMLQRAPTMCHIEVKNVPT